jgi:class 3 adenylate cyclase/predicted ATPase
MFTDIVGSTMLRDTLIATHGEGEGNRLYREDILEPHNQRIRQLLAKYDGFEVKTNGDSFMVAFARPEGAVICAAAIQRSLRAEPIRTGDPTGPLAVRIGMHTGDAKYVERDGKPDYDGHAVNIAARVESLLKGGERVYCSGETKVLAKTAPGIRFHSYGPYTLKGVSARIEIFDILWDDALQPAPPEQPHDSLPYPWLTQWVGREREMTELAEALRASRLVTLHGTGGVGKTRLAVETLLARGGGLPREIVFVSLAAAADTQEGLLVVVREALGLTEVDAPDLESLCRQLRGGDRLLLLDNFESVKSAATSVPRLATTPGVRVLVTSQQALGVPGERVTELDPMETQGDLAALESHRLFVGLAQQRDARWQPDDETAMRDVLVATDGLPYLIELVAAVAPKRKLWQLADEIKNVRARYPGRHSSIDDCLEWALERLPQKERDALPRLAIFTGGFDARAAEEVAGTAIESLDVLVDASLLRFDCETGRYSMLPTTQQFLSARLGEQERTRLATAHAEWFIERLDRADDALRAKGGETQMAARRWIDAEYENIRQAVARAEEGEPELFRRAVESFAIYLQQTCRFSEEVALNETLLRRIDPETATQQWARTQNNLGIAYRNLPTGDRGENLAKAIACYEAALRVRSERNLPTDWASTQNNLGVAYSELPAGDRGENLAKAIACFEAALRVWTERDFPADWATTQNNLGNAYSELPTDNRADNLAKAIAFYEAALRVWTERDFPTDWATAQNNLAITYARLTTGDRDENRAKAIACYETALRVWTERDFPAQWRGFSTTSGTPTRSCRWTNEGRTWRRRSPATRRQRRYGQSATFQRIGRTRSTTSGMRIQSCRTADRMLTRAGRSSASRLPRAGISQSGSETKPRRRCNAPRN